VEWLKEGAMPEGYKIYQVESFIRKTEEGQLDIDKSKAIVRELAIASTHHKDHNILVDLRETAPLQSFYELLTVALEFANYQDIFANKMAFIIPNSPDRIERAEFFKAGLAEGKFQLEYFTAYEKALEWLSEIQEHQ
jgi:hypothetical protein